MLRRQKNRELEDRPAEEHSQSEKGDAYCYRPRHTKVQKNAEPANVGVLNESVVEEDQRQACECGSESEECLSDHGTYAGRCEEVER